MGMDDDRVDVVERDTADFIAASLDHQETAVSGQMVAIGGDIDDPVHIPRPRLFTRPRIEHAAERIDADLTSFEPLQTSSGRQNILKGVQIVWCGVPGLECASFVVGR